MKAKKDGEKGNKVIINHLHLYMDCDERLTALMHLFAEISEKIVKELEISKDVQKIKIYSEQLQQIDKELQRINIMKKN